MGFTQLKYDEKEDHKSIDSYYDKLDSLKWHDGKYYSNIPYVLPAMGTSRESCGHYFYRGCIGPTENDIQYPDVFNHKHKLHPENTGIATRSKNVCGKLSCPVCYKDTINKLSIKAGNRMQAFQILLRSQLFLKHEKRIYNHYVISPPHTKDISDRKKLSNWIRSIHTKIQSMGIIGGLTIFHPFRFDKDFNPYYSPHLHIIAAGWTNTDDIKNFYEKTGTVLTKVNSVLDIESVTGIIRYLLSHSMQLKTQSHWHSIRYYGLAQNSIFKTADILTGDACNISIDSIPQFDKITQFLIDHNVKNIKCQIVTSTDEDRNLKEIEFSAVKDITIENPAKPISDTLKIKEILEDHLNIGLIIACYYNEKRHIFYVNIDRNTKQLCPICNGYTHMIIPVDSKPLLNDVKYKEVQITNYLDDDYNEELYEPKNYFYNEMEEKPLFDIKVNPFEAKYPDPKTDFIYGLPYFKDGFKEMFLEQGLNILNPAFNKQDLEHKNAQCDLVVKSLSRLATCKAREQASIEGKIVNEDLIENEHQKLLSNIDDFIPIEFLEVI